MCREAALVALGFPPNCGGPDDVCREAQHLSLLLKEAQETHHEVGRVTHVQGIRFGHLPGTQSVHRS